MANPVILNQDQLNQLIAAVAPGQMAGAAADQGRRKLTIFSSAVPTEWRTWRRNFSTIAIINGWNDIRQRREAASAMEGSAALAVQDIDHETANDIEELLDGYQSRFIPEAASKMARSEFNTSFQKPNETLIQWHTRLRELFCRSFPHTDIEDNPIAIDQFVNFLLDASIQMYVLDNNPGTFSEALNLAQNKRSNQMIMKKTSTERGLNQMSYNGEEEINAMGRPWNNRSQGNRGGRGRNQRGNDRKCWYCGKPGHVKRDCTHWQAEQQQNNTQTFSQTSVTGGNGGGNGNHQRGGRGGRNNRGNQNRGGYNNAAPYAMHAMQEPESEQYGEDSGN